MGLTTQPGALLRRHLRHHHRLYHDLFGSRSIRDRETGHGPDGLVARCLSRFSTASISRQQEGLRIAKELATIVEFARTQR